jgi:hypothetical protein
VFETLPGGAGVTRIFNETELTDVLAAYGLPGPVPCVPASVSAAQAKLALDAVITVPGEEVEEGVFVGRVKLLDDVEAMTAAHPVRAVRIWFADANVWERTPPTSPRWASRCSLDDDAIDALFVAADLYSSQITGDRA